MTLEDLTVMLLQKYKRGGVASGSKGVEYQIHFAYLVCVDVALLLTFTETKSPQRYYAPAHHYGSKVAAEAADSGAESEEAPTEGDADEPAAKRARTASRKAPPGRVKSGKDFWGAMDRRLTKDIELNGKDMKNEKWRR